MSGATFRICLSLDGLERFLEMEIGVLPFAARCFIPPLGGKFVIHQIFCAVVFLTTLIASIHHLFFCSLLELAASCCCHFCIVAFVIKFIVRGTQICKMGGMRTKICAKVAVMAIFL